MSKVYNGNLYDVAVAVIAALSLAVSLAALYFSVVYQKNELLLSVSRYNMDAPASTGEAADLGPTVSSNAKLVLINNGDRSVIVNRVENWFRPSEKSIGSRDGCEKLLGFKTWGSLLARSFEPIIVEAKKTQSFDVSFEQSRLPGQFFATDTGGFNHYLYCSEIRLEIITDRKETKQVAIGFAEITPFTSEIKDRKLNEFWGETPASIVDRSVYRWPF